MFPLSVACLLRPVSGSGCGPIPACLFVAFRAIVPYRALAFVNRVLTSVMLGSHLPGLTTPVLVCLGAYGLPIEKPLHGVYLFQSFEH